MAVTEVKPTVIKPTKERKPDRSGFTTALFCRIFG